MAMRRPYLRGASAPEPLKKPSTHEFSRRPWTNDRIPSPSCQWRIPPEQKNAFVESIRNCWACYPFRIFRRVIFFADHGSRAHAQGFSFNIYTFHVFCWAPPPCSVPQAILPKRAVFPLRSETNTPPPPPTLPRHPFHSHARKGPPHLWIGPPAFARQAPRAFVKCAV